MKESYAFMAEPFRALSIKLEQKKGGTFLVGRFSIQ
jgi:hypothetical protein